jgi:hypothetical protein
MAGIEQANSLDKASAVPLSKCCHRNVITEHECQEYSRMNGCRIQQDEA